MPVPAGVAPRQLLRQAAPSIVESASQVRPSGPAQDIGIDRLAALDRPDGLHIGDVHGCWDGRRPQGGGHPSSRSISAGTRPARLRRVCIQTSKNLCAHQRPAGRLIPYVRLDPAMR